MKYFSRVLYSVYVAFSIFFLSTFSFPQQTNQANETNTQFLEQFYRGEEERGKEKVKTPNPLWTGLKVIFYLAILGGGGYLLIRWIISKGSIPQTEDSKFIELILTKSIGLNSYIHIVKIINDYYILSQSQDGIKLIEKITDKETIDFIELNKEQMKPKEVKFIDLIGNLPSYKKVDKIAFLKSQKERLKKL